MSMTVTYSLKVMQELSKRGATQEIFDKLGETVQNIPRKAGLEVDTSDNAITVLGMPISFVRDHKNGEVHIMTNAEALQLDSMKG